MARITRRGQPGPTASIIERLEYAANELGLELDDIVEDNVELTASDLEEVFKKLKNVNSEYILSGTGPAVNTTIRSRRVKDYTGINKRIKIIRHKEGLTQAEFGKKIGYARATIASIEQNHQTISFAAIRKISEIFEVSYEYIIDGVDTPSKEVSILREQLAECIEDKKALRTALNLK